MNRICLLVSMALAIVITSASPLAAQTSAPAASRPVPPPATIRAEAVARHLAVLAQDSFQGRTTPSTALKRTARYVAVELARAEVESGDRVHRYPDTAWLPRYPLPRQLALDYASTGVSLPGVIPIPDSIPRERRGCCRRSTT